MLGRWVIEARGLTPRKTPQEWMFILIFVASDFLRERETMSLVEFHWKRNQAPETHFKAQDNPAILLLPGGYC